MQQLLRQVTPIREKSIDEEAPDDEAAPGDEGVLRDKEASGKVVHIPQRAIYNKRLEFIQGLFDIKPENVAKFPGIESYCDYLEREAFVPLTSPSFDSIWGLVPYTNPKEIADRWDWILAVLQAIGSEETEISIHDILQRLKKRKGDHSAILERCKDKSCFYIAIFGVLCWSSMVARPNLLSTDNTARNLTCLLPHGSRLTKDSATHALSSRHMRPIPLIFRSFKMQHWGDQLSDRVQGGSWEGDSLYKASLSIYSLRYFGHVTIQWVDTISEHLRFNPATRRLSLFRFPTFCALLAIYGANVSLTIQSISEQIDPLSPEDRDQCCVSLEQEVLLSYRLLFGQDGMSRKVAHDEICRLKKIHANQSVDTMLLDLCERKYKHGGLWWRTYDTVLQNYPSEMWPVTCRNMKGQLLESDVYSVRNDFPRLGPRLLKLQQFNLRQRPNKLIDLWRDRRNPLQWYTFWAVVIVGGVANILAALQLLVAIIELQTSF
ncbi:uncharacterized protein BDW47DRAFT_103417 [Aspergillus candidus]|uniref:Uncharacterized protein n=1 Tax=Aspergillus candidus TaxID=41067 RepID=A0A2I2FF92_ASPCN|nr:hypothetical protein BDW47DRAFT_103417 [Aspergillus candidus]PLB39306.1 hypothetical protein BDW47DRAFT_103417 [Aspergillus candidus]